LDDKALNKYGAQNIKCKAKKLQIGHPHHIISQNQTWPWGKPECTLLLLGQLFHQSPKALPLLKKRTWFISHNHIKVFDEAS
jgi:hypothetical protein